MSPEVCMKRNLNRFERRARDEAMLAAWALTVGCSERAYQHALKATELAYRCARLQATLEEGLPWR